MDGINGIAGITGIFTFVLLGTYGVTTAQPSNLVNLCFGITYLAMEKRATEDIPEIHLTKLPFKVNFTYGKAKTAIRSFNG